MRAVGTLVARGAGGGGERCLEALHEGFGLVGAAAIEPQPVRNTLLRQQVRGLWQYHRPLEAVDVVEEAEAVAASAFRHGAMRRGGDGLGAVRQHGEAPGGPAGGEEAVAREAARQQDAVIVVERVAQLQVSQHEIRAEPAREAALAGIEPQPCQHRWG